MRDHLVLVVLIFHAYIEIRLKEATFKKDNIAK